MNWMNAQEQKGDYIAGPHNPRVHFWCGLVFGAALGAITAWNIFDGGWDIAAFALLGAGALAYCGARWGDRAWAWALSLFCWFA